MNRFFNKIKKLVSASVIGVSLLGLITAAGPGAKAAGPFFNGLQGDRDQLVGRTQNQASYADPVTATTNDKVTVALYIHNGGDSVATNTMVRLQNMTPGDSQTQVLRSFIGADNATTVSETVVNGQVVGNPDLTINLDKLAQMQYVPGSTVFFPDLSGNPNQPGIPMPDGIMSAQGLNIGDRGFCWSTVSYILADFVFTNQVLQPTLQTDKWVALFGGGNNTWVKQNTAQPGDLMRYQVYFNNSGNGDATNVAVVDHLPAGVTYQAGSVSKRVKDANNNDVDILIPDSQLTISGQTITIPLGTVKPGQNNSGFVYMRVQVDNLAVGTHTLTNTADVTASNAATVSASAITTVVVNQVPKPVVKTLKQVANLTQGTATWATDNTAKPGDTMQYRITVYNEGNAAADNVSVKDTLPQYVGYVAGSTKIFTTTDPNTGQALPDGIVASGVNIGTVSAGVPQGNKFIVFNVVITTAIPAGNHDLVNIAEVFMNNVKQDESTARTVVTAETGLLIEKTVWNANTGLWVTSLSGVKPGDTVIFRIQIKNTGTTKITNPVINDMLPPELRYVANSTQMDGSVMVNDTWITQNAGILTANADVGFVKTVTFKVVVGPCPPGGTSTYTNKATVVADGLAQKMASADVVVTAGPPPLPPL